MADILLDKTVSWFLPGNLQDARRLIGRKFISPCQSTKNVSLLSVQILFCVREGIQCKQFFACGIWYICAVVCFTAKSVNAKGKYFGQARLPYLFPILHFIHFLLPSICFSLQNGRKARKSLFRPYFWVFTEFIPPSPQ